MIEHSSVPFSIDFWKIYALVNNLFFDYRLIQHIGSLLLHPLKPVISLELPAQMVHILVMLVQQLDRSVELKLEELFAHQIKSLNDNLLQVKFRLSTYLGLPRQLRMYNFRNVHLNDGKAL